jgi:integrase
MAAETGQAERQEESREEVGEGKREVVAKKTIQKRDGVYTRKDRAGFYISWTDAQGRRRCRKTDAANITQAKQIRAAELLRVEQARMLGHNPPGAETFKEVADRFLKYQKARLTPKAYEREESILRLHLSRFNSLKLSSIRKIDVQQYVTDRSGEVSPASVRRELSVLTHLFSLAVEWEIVPVNPAQRIKSPKLPPGRVRYLQPTELKAVLEACPNGLREIVALLVSTGMRRGEVMGLRYLDVDIQNGRIVLPQTKNNTSRVVHLNQMAIMVLKSLPPGEPGDKLFADWTPNQVSTQFIRVCVRLKILDFSIHDLRHTTASWMRMSGADIHTVAEQLGHKTLNMARRYQHLSPAFMSDAVGKLDAVFSEASGAISAKNGEERYQDVTAQLALTDGDAGSG